MKKISSLMHVVLTAILLYSFSGFMSAQYISESKLKNILDKYEAEYEDISVTMGTANWNVYSNEGDDDQDTPKQRYCELFNNAELNSAINSWTERKDELADNTLKRRLEVWKNILTAAAVDFDTDIFKLENELEALLSNPGESDTAYTKDELNEKILTLLNKRNIKAKELGYDNYAVLCFEINGLGWDWFNKTIELIDQKTLEPYKQFLEKMKNEKNVTEVGYQDVVPYIGAVNGMRYFQKLDPSKNDSLMIATLDGIGIDYDKLPIRFVVENIPYGGNGLAIQVPNDFRVVMKDGMPLAVWMHELGHGLHAMFNKTEYPILKGYEWCLGSGCAAFAEGMAETSANLVRNDKWIEKYADNTPEDFAKRDETFKNYGAAFIRQAMVGFMFEVEMYKDLSQDLNALRENMFKKYLLLDKPLANGNLNLSENIMYVAYPLYMQNYFFANMIAWQVHQTLEKKFGEDYVFNKKVKNFLVDEFYGDGDLIPWREKMKHATDSELDIDGFLAYMGIN